MKILSIGIILFLFLSNQNTFSQRPTEGLDITNQQADLKRNKVETITYTQYIYKHNQKNEVSKTGWKVSVEAYDTLGNKIHDIGFNENGSILTQTWYRLIDTLDLEIIRGEAYINKDTIRTLDTVLVANIKRNDANILSNTDFKGFYRYTYDKDGLIKEATWYKRIGESSDIKDMTPLLLMKLSYTFLK